MNDSMIIKLVAIICLTIMEIVALLNGMDHQLMITVSGIIGGIAGYEFRKVLETKESKRRLW